MASPGRLARPYFSIFAFSLLSLAQFGHASKICVIGGGMSGASLAYFISKESLNTHDIHIFEKSEKLGGRVATVEIGGEIFEAGASIAHDKNYHLSRFVFELGLEKKRLTGEDYGIWNGHKFIMRQLNEKSKWWPLPTIYNTLSIAFKYGSYHLRALSEFVETLLSKWLMFYDEHLPAFETPDAMLHHAGLLGLTQTTLGEALLGSSVSTKIIDDIVTAIIRIQYGQSANITALPGAVGLAGTGAALWQVKGGNFQIVEGLARLASANVHFSTSVTAVTRSVGGGEGEGDGSYSLTLGDGSTESCDTVAVACPLSKSGLKVDVKVPPPRAYHHTHTTFVKGMINPYYFGFKSDTSLPGMIGTVEDPTLPFSSLSRQQSREGDGWPVFKIFSRSRFSEDLVNQMFSKQLEVVRVDWAAYPLYQPPQTFTPFLLDKDHLYYVNTFEDAASAMEAVAVAAKNVARLMLTRLGEKITIRKPAPEEKPEGVQHEEL